MKRILIFSVAYHPFIGGAEVAVKEITDRISDASFEMITLNLDGKQPSQEKIGNVLVHRIGNSGKVAKLLFPFKASAYASRLHAENKFDVMWSIMASFSGFAALFFKKKYKDVHFLLTLQEGDPISYIKRQVWFVYPWFKQIFRYADAIQAISHYLADFARSMGARGTISVVPNGVDMKLFSAPITDAMLEATREELGIQDGERVLITTSRLVKKNGIEDVIRALPHLPHSLKFVIVGSGPLELKLRQTVSELRLESRVLFVGQKPYQELPKYLAVSDIFIRPSLSEGMGNSFIEAMAARVPIIATPVGGITDFLIDNETGIFCKVQDPKSIRIAIEKILDNPSLSDSIRAKAWDKIQDIYEWEPIAVKLKHLLTIS